jgi:hypothetical protein
VEAAASSREPRTAGPSLAGSYIAGPLTGAEELEDSASLRADSSRTDDRQRPDFLPPTIRLTFRNPPTYRCVNATSGVQFPNANELEIERGRWCPKIEVRFCGQRRPAGIDCRALMERIRGF